MHEAKAKETIGAILQLRKDGILADAPLDVMGFSDGGIITLAMLAERPDLFSHFNITNTPSLDNSSTMKSYRQGFREIMHLGAHKILERLGKGEMEYHSQSQVPFKREQNDGYAESSYQSNPGMETRAVARTRSLIRLLPGILARNSNLRGFIVNTESDKMSPADRVEKELSDTLHGDARITARRTGWAKHTMGYGSVERPEKLKSQATIMKELRGNAPGSNTAGNG